MLLRFSEQIINNFLVPSFSLANGEIVIIRIPEGEFFYPLKLEIVKMLTGEAVNDNVEIVSALQFVADFEESYFRYRFFPTTIDSYHNKYANKANPVYKNIYGTEGITPQTKVKTVDNTLRRLLSLYTTLSWTNNIVFHLAGIGPQGGQDIYRIVKTMVNSGGAAILIDRCDEFQNDCTTFIKAGYIDSL
jgi:hypothetical protein